MDPCTIAGTILGTTRICLATTKTLYDLCDKYRHASITITAIYTESVVIGASLQRIQKLLSQSGQNGQNGIDELADIFEAALTGCTLVYSRLDNEIELLKSDTNEAGEVNRRGRARYIWKEDTMKELLQLVRAQNSALTLLLQCLNL
jgi:hypothetical protein